MLGAILRTTISNGRGNVTTSLLATRRSNDSFVRCYHMTRPVLGFEEFYDDKKNPNDVILVGRSWTVPDLRRKNFEDLHKLWFVLYKERNLLLSEREKARRSVRPVTKNDEIRYMKVKRSMGAIKFVLSERRRIRYLIATTSGVDSDNSENGNKSEGLSGELKPGFKKVLKKRVTLKKNQRRQMVIKRVKHRK